MATENIFPADPKHSKPQVSSGLSYVDACLSWLDRVDSKRAYILASGTLSRKTTLLTNLRDALGKRLVGVRVGMSSHTYMGECLEVLDEIRRLEADCIVTLGGGSLSDAAKIISFAEANNVHTRDEMLALPHMMSKDPAPAKPSRLPFILIPTTLSGGEYSRYSGVTDETSHVKYQYLPPLEPADVVILDGNVAATTPLDVWISSGVRCVDHCCEALCSLLPRASDWPEVETACVDALRDLIPGLLATVRNPGDAEGRHRGQLGAVSSLVPLSRHVYPGASHGIGHILGPMGVLHGMTSCILMPAVHKYNARANEELQAFVRRTLWSIPEGRELFVAKGLQEDKADLGDLLDCFIRAVNMPRSLSEVGIVGEEKLQMLAKNSLMDTGVTRDNPVPLKTEQEVMVILKQVE